MTKGTVKWINAQKGFGFIVPDNGGAVAFVHISAVERAGLFDLREGQKVSFDLVPDRRTGKMSAEKLEVLAGSIGRRLGRSAILSAARIVLRVDHGWTGDAAIRR